MLSVYQKLNDYVRKASARSSSNAYQTSNSVDLSSTDTVSIANLPEEILLNIFSYLPLKDLCSCSFVSTTWNRISDDIFLWNYKILLESYNWVGIISKYPPTGPISHPKDMYTSINPIYSLSSKELIRSGVLVYFSLILKSCWGHKPPHIATLGSGLDNFRTRKLFHRMFRNNCPEFEPTGQFMPAVGSGVTMKLISGDNYPYKFHFYMLYSFKPVSKYSPSLQEQRIRESVLFEKLADHESLRSLRLRESVREIFDGVHGLIYSIDAADSEDDFRSLICEFKLVVGSIGEDVPVLVILINADGAGNAAGGGHDVSTFHIAQLFELYSLPNPWCILSAFVKDLLVLKLGIIWLIQKTFKM